MTSPQPRPSLASNSRRGSPRSTCQTGPSKQSRGHSTTPWITAEGRSLASMMPKMPPNRANCAKWPAILPKATRNWPAFRALWISTIRAPIGCHAVSPSNMPLGFALCYRVLPGSSSPCHSVEQPYFFAGISWKSSVVGTRIMSRRMQTLAFA